MSKFASILLLAFFLKWMACFLSAKLLERYCRDLLEAFIAGWVLVELGLIAAMLLLSPFSMLTGSALWIVLIAGNCILFLCLRLSEKHTAEMTTTPSYAVNKDLFTHPLNIIALTLIMLAFSAFAYRSIYFFDTSWDALTYEIPRVLFWAQRSSLFISEPTKMLNIFANEWNGELNGLSYLLLTGNDQGVNFGNAEIWLFSCLGYAWFGGIFGVPHRFRFLFGLVLASLPPIFALSMTVKGDLLAITCFVVAVGWVYRYFHEDKSRLFVILAYASFGLAVGAKIVVAVSVALIIAILFINEMKSLRGSNKEKKKLVILSCFAGGALFLVGCSRYIVNLFTYGNPIIRLEKANALLTNLLDNIQNIGYSYFDIFSKKLWHGFVWTLGFNYGFAIIIVIAALIMLILSKKSPFVKNVQQNEAETHSGILFRVKNYLTLIIRNKPYQVIVSCAIILGFFPLSLSTVWYPWSLRYFVPWIQILLACFLVIVFKKASFFEKSRVPVITLGIIFIILSCVHFSIMFRHGEGRVGSFKQARGRSQIERKTALHPYLILSNGNIPDQKKINLKKLKIKKILILNYMDSAILQYFGDNREIWVDLSDSMSTFLSRSQTVEYGMVAIVKPNIKFTKEEETSMKRNFKLIFKNDYNRIYIPLKKNDIRETQ